MRSLNKTNGSYKDIDSEKMEVKKSDKSINLTAVQFSILKLLISNPGRVFKREELLGAFQEDIYEGYERTIDVHIKNIRKVLEDDPSHPKYLVTVWGVGYKFSENEVEIE